MTGHPQGGPLRVLVLCTGNSARSQMAEALFNSLGAGRIVADSAGTRPSPRVNPLAIDTLARNGIAFKGHAPQGLDGVIGRHWDFVITVCDNAKESCPVFPGHTVTAHWGMPDPTEAGGTDEERRAAFQDAFRLIRRRIDLMLALPIEKLERLAREQAVRGIARET